MANPMQPSAVDDLGSASSSATNTTPGYTAPTVATAATAPVPGSLESDLVKAQQTRDALQAQWQAATSPSRKNDLAGLISDQDDTIARLQAQITARGKSAPGTNQAEAGLYDAQAERERAQAGLATAQTGQVGQPSGDALLQAQSSAASTSAVNRRTDVDAGIASLRADVDREGLALKDKELNLTNQWKSDQISLERWKVEMENAQRDYDRAVKKLEIAVQDRAVQQRAEEAAGNQAVQREATASTANNQRVSSAASIGSATGQLTDAMLQRLAPADAISNVLSVLGGADPSSLAKSAMQGINVSDFDPYAVVGGAAARERQALGYTAPIAGATPNGPLNGQPSLQPSAQPTLPAAAPSAQPQLLPQAQAVVNQAAANAIDGTDVHPDSTFVYDLTGVNV